MNLNEQQINDILTELQPSIVNSLKDEIAKDVKWQVLNVVSNEISKYTQEWVKENIIPELQKELIENKDSLISIGAKLSTTITNDLTRALTESMHEKLKTSYRRDEILKALFR